MSDTIDWYDRNADRYDAGAFNLDLSPMRDAFQALIPAGSRILEVGCAGGRDALAFKRAGYLVTAIEPSLTLARMARTRGVSVVYHQRVQELGSTERFEGVWACGSLLHVPDAETPDVFARIRRALVPGGAFFCCYKLGSGEEEREGRFFHDENTLSLVNKLTGAGFGLHRVWETDTVRPDASTRWINALAYVPPVSGPPSPA